MDLIKEVVYFMLVTLFGNITQLVTRDRKMLRFLLVSRYHSGRTGLFVSIFVTNALDSKAFIKGLKI